MSNEEIAAEAEKTRKSYVEFLDKQVDRALVAAEEVARLAMFGHAPSCEGAPHAGDDTYDVERCNFCRKLDALRQARQKLGK